MARNFMWTDDLGRRRMSTEIFDAADVTDEILRIAKALDDEWFAKIVSIDWQEFFRDLGGTVIPSTGRELALGDDQMSPAMHRIQRHILKRRMARLARWRLVTTRQGSDDEVPARTPLRIVAAPHD
jgi:hypothetical protein